MLRLMCRSLAEFACEIERRDIDSLRPNPKSARTHPKRKIRDLAKAIKVVGFIGVIVVDELGMILAGHARHAAAKLLGMKAVPTICVTGLSDELVRLSSAKSTSSSPISARRNRNPRTDCRRPPGPRSPAAAISGSEANTGFCAATRGSLRITPVS